MLEVQNYLKYKSLEDLNLEYGIIATYNSEMPLVILNYHQTDSCKTATIVRECRNLILSTVDYSLVSRSFYRFFNFGENTPEMEQFHWPSCTTMAKEDGSLLNFFYYEGNWHVTTRGSFANAPIFNQYQAKYFNMPENFTWKDAILRTLNCTNLNELNLDPKLSYACEFCSLWNKVVRTYPVPTIYLLSCFAGEEEVGPQKSPFKTVETFPLCNSTDIFAYINAHPEDTFEGMIIKDKDNRRFKLKSDRWKALHRMKGNGENLYLPKNLIPWILSGNNKILDIYPEITECFHNYKTKVDSAYKEVEELWNSTKHIQNQKDFALAIVKNTRFSSILFNIRKTGNPLQQEWNKSEALILKVLFS